MNDQDTVLLREASSPEDAEPRRARFTLPPRQLAKARSRLAFLTLVFAGMCVVAIGIDRTLYRFSEYELLPVYVFNGVTSTILLILTRIRGLGNRTVLNFGLVYEILMCLSVSTGFTLIEYRNTGEPPTVTWVCIVMVAFPLIIPTSPRRTLWETFLAAATVPLGLYILQLSGSLTPRPFDYVHVSLSPLLCIPLAVLGSWVVYGLNVEVALARRMGSYQLVERLGSGGMGEVWSAKHRLMARPAAVKLVRPEIRDKYSPAGNERLLERFKREAQVTAGLESPHTVRLYDFGISDQGVFYYVMELLNGLDLERLVVTYGAQPPERVVHVLLQMCHSLREAHDQGLIHRDIKPSNLVLCRRRAGDYDVVKVLDFGMVALRTEAVADTSRITVEGQVGGTPAYMPPETISEEDDVDARADIYSVGCVAYWLLTGSPVFERKNPMKTILAHVQEAPVPPSRRAELEIPPALERLVLECLEKHPDQRPRSAEDLADRLRATGLAPDWTQDRAREWWELNPPEETRASSSEDTTVGEQGRFDADCLERCLPVD
jgi:serine/threonine-protein kinase